MLLTVSLYLLLSLPLHNSLRVLQRNAGGLRARSTKLLHFISSHPVDLIFIQEPNLNLSSSFRIPGFSALQSHGTHSRSGIFSTDGADASGGVIVFVKQGLFFSELSTSSLSSLGPYSDYVVVNISLNDSSSLSLLNVYVPPIRSSTKDRRTNFFSFSILPSYAEAVDCPSYAEALHSSLLCGSGGLFALPLPQKKYRFHIPGYNGVPLTFFSDQDFKLLNGKLAQSLGVVLGRDSIRQLILEKVHIEKQMLSSAMKHKLFFMKFDGATRFRSHYLGINIQYFDKENGITTVMFSFFDSIVIVTS